uniref:RsbT co-antagonist protein RsbRD N-terminal domain-containing protein n=1 Tax=uncultured sulfate-reducing bacterium TaxID=153939 RepID=Q3IBL2_9BACT|nr:conserved hypothetical protein [uncultured sulfate-reducing bacterium]
MELREHLKENRGFILGKWFDRIIKSYPANTSEFLAKQKDQFRNPVGHAITKSIGPIYDEITSSMDDDELLRALDGVIRIRAVQDFSASKAVAFVFELKAVIRDSLGDNPGRLERSGELRELDSRIDQVALLTFDKYTECREKLHEVRNNEIKNRSTRLLERINARPAIPPHEGEAPR